MGRNLLAISGLCWYFRIVDRPGPVVLGSGDKGVDKDKPDEESDHDSNTAGTGLSLEGNLLVFMPL